VFTTGIIKVFEGEGTRHSAGFCSGSGGVTIGEISSSTATVGLGFERDDDFDLRLLEVTGAKDSTGLGGTNISSFLGSSGGKSGRAGLPGTGVEEAVVEGVTLSASCGFEASDGSLNDAGISSNSKDALGLPFSRY